MVTDLLMKTAPKPAASSATTSPPAATWNNATAKVRHGAVSLQPLKSSSSFPYEATKTRWLASEGAGTRPVCPAKLVGELTMAAPLRSSDLLFVGSAGWFQVSTPLAKLSVPPLRKKKLLGTT